MPAEEKKSKRSDSVVLIVSICAGIILGLLARGFPGNVLDAALDYAVTPLMSIILGLFTGLMVPFVFMEITNAICSQTGKKDVGSLVGKMMGRFVAIVFSITAFSALVSMLFFRPSGKLTEAFDAGIVIDQFRAIIPTDIFRPFIEGNILQVVIISVFVGICLLLLGDRVSGIVRFFSEGSILTEKMFGILAKTVPLVAFLSMFKLAATSSAQAVRNVWKVIPAVYLADIFSALFFALFLSWRRKVSVGKVVKIFRRPLIRAFASGTSSVVIGDIIDISEEHGISGRLVRLHAPMSFVFLSTGYSILYVCSVFCMAELTGTAISAQKLLLIILLVFQFTVATPRVSGGCLTVFTVLLTQLGIPTDGAAVILILSLLSSNLTTGLAVFIKIIDELYLAYSQDAVTGDAFSRAR